MNKKIVITTDLSNNSKSGIRFAMQLASQGSFSLIFLHVVELLIPTRWNDVKAKVYMDEHLRDEQENLTRFVKSVYKDASVRPRNIECVVRYGAPVSETVINYAIEQKASFICIGTRGAASVRKILGTHTSSIIKQSPIPVFAVPKNFSRIPIDHIMYASDLIDFKNEVKAVKAVASILNAKVSVLHYDYFLQIKEAKAEFRKIASRYGSSNIDFHLQKFDWEKSLADHIEKAIRKFKPSVVALFTKQDRNWYQRIFLSSKSADVTYDTKKPILVFPKA